MDLGILAALADRIEWYDSLGSTNDRGRELAEKGAPHGFVVGTEEQTAGRGRKGAGWLSEPGRGLTFSVVVRPAWPKARWGWLSLGAGLAVCRALDRLELAASMKWPNDVLLEERKVCGILIEAVGPAAVVGIGINVNDEGLPDGLGAISLREACGEAVSREAVLLGVWDCLLEVLELDPPDIAEKVWTRLAWREREVETSQGVRGRIRGFGENGELTIESTHQRVTVSEAGTVRPVDAHRDDG